MTPIVEATTFHLDYSVQHLTIAMRQTATMADVDRDSRSRQLVSDFYAAFARLDHAAMARLYAGDARFSDPVFRQLYGDEVTAMWRMLCTAATDLDISVRDVTANGDRAAATWDAHYTFTETGRRVHNVVEAHMIIADGRITRHDDHFDLWRWSRQALGPAGLLLGWTPLVRSQVRRRARQRLDRFIAGESPAQR
jgi:ketosteroid isomerase-like protein